MLIRIKGANQIRMDHSAGPCRSAVRDLSSASPAHGGPTIRCRLRST